MHTALEHLKGKIKGRGSEVTGSTLSAALANLVDHADLIKSDVERGTPSPELKDLAAWLYLASASLPANREFGGSVTFPESFPLQPDLIESAVLILLPKVDLNQILIGLFEHKTNRHRYIAPIPPVCSREKYEHIRKMNALESLSSLRQEFIVTGAHWLPQFLKYVSVDQSTDLAVFFSKAVYLLAAGEELVARGDEIGLVTEFPGWDGCKWIGRGSIKHAATPEHTQERLDREWARAGEVVNALLAGGSP